MSWLITCPLFNCVSKILLVFMICANFETNIVLKKQTFPCTFTNVCVYILRDYTDANELVSFF